MSEKPPPTPTPPTTHLRAQLQLRAERIYWDQATVLAQLGLLDPGDLPITGEEQAAKAADGASLPSNSLIQQRVRH